MTVRTVLRPDVNVEQTDVLTQAAGHRRLHQFIDLIFQLLIEGTHFLQHLQEQKRDQNPAEHQKHRSGRLITLVVLMFWTVGGRHVVTLILTVLTVTSLWMALSSFRL